MKHLVALVLPFLFTLHVIAQEKNDVVLKVNGDELTGKVTEIGDSEIKFVYKGETLVYAIKKSDIIKITYASGRIEFFNKPSLPSEAKEDKPKPGSAISNDADRRNKIAILPFTFITDKQGAGEDMGYQAQNECYTFLSKHSGELTVIDPRTTNALLIKAGATADKIRGFTMDELCAIIGVEYIIDATVTMDKTSQTSSQSGSIKGKEEYNSKDNKNEVKASTNSYSTSAQNYQTKITMNVFTDKNTNIFSQERQSFWNTTDAYVNSLQFLLKKTPLYRK
ncbi:hypothetical protein I5907_11710 [Panacibacter sp. DH6]|uniref:Uncharacterized protein n=1 Tax=Panacibacter microcysteis TaxID=2793269 RepID=A0A931E673_9BACT|nr:hypothetical protein [Panacibacter microcysteis]MBG9376907.1 hypothetical protein [Panacibacter microcysteis]